MAVRPKRDQQGNPYPGSHGVSRRVLVTGAAGFIGSHVVEALLSRGDQVVGMDNFDPYYDVGQKRTNLAEVTAAPGSNRFYFVEGDIRNRDLVNSIFASRNLDAVIHLAAMAGVRASIEQPDVYVDVNVSGTLNLLEAARVHGLGNFVFASTSSVYGNSVKLPFQEDMPADRQLSPYAATKRAAASRPYCWSLFRRSRSWLAERRGSWRSLNSARTPRPPMRTSVRHANYLVMPPRSPPWRA